MRVHFIAIGGAAMHNLALALHHKGHRVTGSDDHIVDPSRSRLAEAGLLPPSLGWHPEKITPELDAIILGMHARTDNPELLKAQQLGLRVYSFPEFLYEQTRGKRRLVIGGSHGKTTVTSLVMHALHHRGWSFDYLVGAQLEGFDTMVGLGLDSRLAVFEGDEYLSSPIDPRPKFHLYRPNLALINGISWDHANVFPTPEMYEEQFRIFASLVEPGGTVLYNREDPAVERVVRSAQPGVRLVSYATPAYRVGDGVLFWRLGEREIPVQLLGRHNMLNLSAALAACRELGVTEDEFAGAVPSFRGAARRMQEILRCEDTRIFLDFAHAPSKVRATVQGLLESFPDHRLLVVLELHTFSSLNRDFVGHYRNSLAGAHSAAVFVDSRTFEIKRLPPLSEADIRLAFDREDLSVLFERATLEEHLSRLELGGAILLLMSSGSFAGLDLAACQGRFRDATGEDHRMPSRD